MTTKHKFQLETAAPRHQNSRQTRHWATSLFALIFRSV